MSVHRARSATIAATLALAISATAHAANLYWENNAASPADLGSASYFNGTGTVAPTAGTENLFIGNNGTATGIITGGGILTVGKLYIGTTDTGGGIQAPAGPGTVSINAGSFTAATGSGQSVNAATIVGYGDTGILSVDGAATSYSTNRMVVGFGNDLNKSATVNITGGTKFSVTGGGLTIGDSPDGTIGIPGHLKVNGTLKIQQNSALQVGAAASNSSYEQTGGAASSLNVVVALKGADNCSFSISGGSYTTSTTFNVANTAGALAENTSISFSGTSNCTFSGMTLAAQSAANTSLAFSGGATVTNNGSLNITDTTSVASNTFMTLADSATVNVSNNFYLGRASTTNTSLTMTGGTLSVGLSFLLGAGVVGTPANATGVVVYQSSGAVITTTAVNATGVPYNFAINDSSTGDSTYNLSGTGTITTVARGIVGRQKGTGAMNQTGGTANFNNSLHIGDSQTTLATDYATGVYNLSAGTLNASVTLAGSTVEAFSIAPAGTGTFRVIGGNAIMNVTGNMGVYANTNGGTNTGKLIYQPLPGQSLTTLNISGTATFNPGSILQLDLSATKPTQGLFTVLNAASIVNNGTLSLPAGWNYSITPGGNGQLLKLFAGDLNADGRINADDYALMDRGFNQHLTTGANGDLNADGSINAADYLLIDSALAQLGGSLSPDFLAERESQFGPGYLTALTAAVPEPASLLACGFAIPTLLTRRRRR